MKNEKKVTIKQKKIMIHKFSRYLLTLVALFAMTAGAWAEGETATITLTSGQTVKTYENVTLPWSTTAEILKEVVTDINFNININAISGGDGKVVKFGNENFTVNGTFSGQATVTVTYNMGSSAIITVTAPGPLMTLSDDGKTATMESMPGSDITIDYELVRDMAISMPVTVGDGEDGYRIRIKKDNQTGKFVPAEMTLQQMMALYTVHDGIENQDLVFYGDGKVCDISIFAVDDDDQPTGDAIAFTALTPGRYVAIATAADGSAYDGTTAPSNIFQLYQGYEVEIAGGEFITYYKDEAIYVEDEDVQLFSITAVGENTATATQFDVIPANKAMLVKNNSAEPKTVLLIPTETDPLSFTWYEGFVGTLEATTILASDATTDRYAFNGKQFVRVKNDLAVGANKAWLEIPAANNARIINISFEETTGIDEMVNGQSSMVNGTWYDLNGRKLDAVPTKKGVYILNGRKVVVK